MAEYIECSKLNDVIEWDNDIGKWVMRDSDLENLPSADVAPVVHGRWYWLAYDANPKIGNWHCSVCNRIPKSLQKEDYCPNCGARMDGDA